MKKKTLFLMTYQWIDKFVIIIKLNKIPCLAALSGHKEATNFEICT